MPERVRWPRVNESRCCHKVYSFLNAKSGFIARDFVLDDFLKIQLDEKLFEAILTLFTERS